MPRASRLSVLIAMAESAALMCRVSSRITSKPAFWSPSYSHCESSPASRPTRPIGSPSPLRKATRASGSLGTFASRMGLPAGSSTHRLLSSSDTSIPTWCSITVPPDGRTRPTRTRALSHHFGRDPPRGQPRCRPITASTGPPTQGGTWPRPLRRSILDWPTPTRLDDHDRLRLPPIPPPQSGGAEKKELGPAATTEHARHQASHSRPLRTTPL